MIEKTRGLAWVLGAGRYFPSFPFSPLQSLRVRDKGGKTLQKTAKTIKHDKILDGLTRENENQPDLD
jgi:hypothetical protein